MVACRFIIQLIVLIYWANTIFVHPFSISNLSSAIENIEKYNGIRIQNGILLRSNAEKTEKNELYEDFWDFTFSSFLPWNIFMQHIIVEKDGRPMSNLICNVSAPTVFIIFEVEEFNLFNKSLGYNSEMDRMNNIFYLIIATSDNTTDEETKRLLGDTTSAFSKYLSKHLINSQLYVIVGQNDDPQLIEIYQSCSTHAPKSRFLLNLLKNQSKIDYIWKRRANLYHCTFRVGYMTSAPHYSVENISNNISQANDNSELFNKNDRQTMIIDGLKFFGPSIHFFSLLKAYLNFSVQLVDTGSAYGIFDENKQDWTGIVGMVKRGEIDTSLSDMSITETRSSAVAFTIAFRHYSYRLFMKRQKPSSSWGTFLKVFNHFYWGLLAITILIFTFILFSFSYIPMYILNSLSLSQSSNVKELIDAVSISLSAFLALDVNISNLATSSKILMLAICICGAVNFYVYNAGLTSCLMVQNTDPPIKELEDILTKPEYKLLMLSGGSSQEYLEYNYPNVWKKSVQENSVIENIADMIKETLEDHKKVSFMGSPTAEILTRKSDKDMIPCKITASKKKYNEDLSGYIFNKNSQYTSLFNYHILKIIQSGVETEWLDNKKMSSDCIYNMDDQIRPFSYKDVISVFVLFASGCTISLLSLVFEYCYLSWKHSDSNRAKYKEKKQFIEDEIQKFRQIELRTKNCFRKIELAFIEKLYRLSQDESLDYQSITEDLNQSRIKISSDFAHFIWNQLQEINAFVDRSCTNSQAITDPPQS